MVIAYVRVYTTLYCQVRVRGLEGGWQLRALSPPDVFRVHAHHQLGLHLFSVGVKLRVKISQLFFVLVDSFSGFELIASVVHQLPDSGGGGVVAGVLEVAGGMAFLTGNRRPLMSNRPKAEEKVGETFGHHFSIKYEEVGARDVA